MSVLAQKRTLEISKLSPLGQYRVLRYRRQKRTRGSWGQSLLLRRITKHVQDQNWFAVGIDFVIVVIGVYCGVWVSNFQESKSTEATRLQVVEILRDDMFIVSETTAAFASNVRQGLSDYELKLREGETPPPYFYRIPGSDRPPQEL